ncbi:MAG: hypothetical protein M4579_003721 [Chaenotheca gracillima]|nr:MAG: hypothetical protein M4579_003721 [Chaenotheca gracillima]
MSLPKPPVAIKNPCSIVHNNILYVYTADALQSISLSKGSKWKKLPGGVSVTGATCVKAVPNGDESQAALYTIGGSTSSSSDQFSGLQRYSLKQRKWESLPLEATVAQNRRDHGAAFINATSSILIYAGSQNGPNQGLSSETFLLDINSPYSITSFPSKAPPVVNPLLLPWNDTHAAMVGGDPTNKKVFLFSNNTGWTDLGLTLQDGLPDKTKVQAAVVEGDDGSKMLETFDMSNNPNTMTRTMLLDSGGSVSSSGKPVRRRTWPTKRHSTGPPPLKRRKRDLKVSNWPPYNNTLAPTTTRSGFSLAQDSNDQVIITGGNDDDPMSVFNPRQNEWMDVNQLLGVPDDVNSQSTPSSASPSSSASSTALPPPGSGTTSDPDVRSKSLTILGATLGAIFGVAIILICILLYLRWRRRKRQFDDAGHQRRASGAVGDDKDRMSFADRGASFMSEAGGYQGRTQHDSMHSTSSVAIMSGRTGKGHTRGLFSKGGKGKSPLGETISLEPSPDRTAVSFAPVPAPAGAVRPRPTDSPNSNNGRQRSSGWSRYFSGNSATNLVHMNSSRSAHTAHSHSSQGSQTPIADSMSRERGSATVAPLRLGAAPFASSQDLSRVASGSPTISHGGGAAGMALSDGMSGHIERHGSVSTVSSTSTGRNDAFSSGIPASIHEHDTWTPVARNEWGSSNDRIASSVYTDSLRGSAVPAFARGADARDSAATLFPRPPQGIPPGPGAPRGQGRYDGPDDGSAQYSDMSWLNLSNTRE